MTERGSGRRRAWYALLLVPYVGLLWPALYAKATPKLFGFPFFYWYEFAWVIVSAAITAVIWLALRSKWADEPRPGEPGEPGA